MSALKCRTCGDRATAMARAVNKDDTTQDWPVCDRHFMDAVLAGWKPVDLPNTKDQDHV